MDNVSQAPLKYFTPADSEHRLTVALDLLITFLQRQSVDGCCQTSELGDGEVDEITTAAVGAGGSVTMPQAQTMVTESG
jgi:hypothetical protein